jgi:hypothetical protein
LAAVLAIAGGAVPGRADVIQTVYYPTSWYTPVVWYSTPRVYVPTAYRVVAPTTVTRTAWTPTYYLTPTAYYYTPTSYYVETYRQGLLGRWYRQRPIYTTARTYYYDLAPTSYVTYWPTSWSVPLATTSALYDPCATPVSEVPLEEPSTTQTSARKAAASGATPKSIQSQSRGVPGTPPAGGTEQQGQPDEPPLSPVPDRSGSAGTDQAAATSSQAAPAPRPGEVDVPGLSGETERRTAYRPRPTELSPLESQLAPNALRGEVVSGADAKPQANVRVVFSDARQTFKDRERVTDDQGRFEVVLPNGDWTVSVAETDGRLTPFGTITSAGGRFYDDRDRVVSSLRLNH